MSHTPVMFRADWNDALFIHFPIRPQMLQPLVPFELDVHEGFAYVSLVAFTQARLRPAFGGTPAAWISAPLARHEFLNFRTYVRRHGIQGIHFLAEWIPNRIAAQLGPRMYGLPYRLGRLNYRHDPRRKLLRGEVRAHSPRLAYRGRIASNPAFAQPGSLDHFLVERYTAFTWLDGISRRFDVAHTPWPIQRASIELMDRRLMDSFAPWMGMVEPVMCHFSTGVTDVSISPPVKILSARTSRQHKTDFRV